MYIIDQKPFNSPAFCIEVTENIKKYADSRNIKPSDLWAARKNKTSGIYEWHINEELLMANPEVITCLRVALAEKYPQQMKRLLDELTFSVDSVLSKVSQMVEGRSFQATLKADCKIIYPTKNNEGWVGSLIDYNSPQTSIGLYVYTKYCKAEGFNDYSKLLDKKLVVQGEIYYRSKSNCFQIKANSIKVIGDCTRMTKEAEWAAECEDILRTWDEVRSYPPEPVKPRKIGLVSSKTAQGYNDFINTLNICFEKKKYKPKVVECNCVTLDVANIVDALMSLKQEPDLDYIAIVRGGGDKESLVKLCEPAMLRAIHDLGNVVTGIGHTEDKLLCGRAALYDAGTPTGAAQFIKAMDTACYSQETARKIQETKAKTGFRNDKERADHWEAAYKQLEKAYNDLLEENSKPKGIFGVIKSFFG